MREKALEGYEAKEKEEAHLKAELEILGKLEKPGAFEAFAAVAGERRPSEPTMRKKKRYGE